MTIDPWVNSQFPRFVMLRQVVTSRYNAVTFIPRALFEQFRRVANLYFLVQGIIMIVGTTHTNRNNCHAACHVVAVR